MILSERDAVIATVSYSDVFSFSLTRSELVYWLIQRRAPIDSKKAERIVAKECCVLGSFIYLPNRKKTLMLRKKRFLYSRNKWDIARRAAEYLKHIPTIELVGVTGALAMNNAEDDDDVDLFIIAGKNRMWVSRLLAILIFELFGIRRRPNEKSGVKDKICLNMFMRIDALRLPQKEQNLYTAHEVLQMHPLWQRKNSYAMFLYKNDWVKKYLPNAWKNKEKYAHTNEIVRHEKNICDFIGWWILGIFENLSKVLQLWYMKKRRTKEVVRDTLMRFHPRDRTPWVKTELGKRFGLKNIALDNVFYDR